MTHLSLINRSFAFVAVWMVWTALFPAAAQTASGHPTLNPIQQNLETYRHTGNIQPVQLWKVSRHLTDLRDAVSNATLLELDANATYFVWENAPEAISLELPNVYGEDFKLEMAKVDILAPDFKLGTLGDHAQDRLPYQAGVYYRGALANDPSSVVAFSFFPNGVMGMIATKEGNYTVGKMEDGSERYIIYRSADLTAQNPARCLTDELPENTRIHDEVDERGGACGGGVQVYFECDYKFYNDKNADETEVSNYVTGLFNQIAALYASESVNISIAQIQIWSSPDPYTPYSSTSSVLSAFRASLGVSFNGNLAHFLTTRNLGGGIAFLDVLCAKSSAFGVSAISNTYKDVPVYSWSVEVVTHELGHNLGSWHTHSCNWAGGPIDNCYNQEGSCSPGPAPTAGGTIMSYCHLTSIGINLANGFGPLPGDRIRSRIAAATCLSSSGGSSTAPTSLSSTNITPNSAALSWTNGGATGSFTVQYKKNGTTAWQTAGTVSTLNYTLSGLTPSTKYDWQVKSACSPYSATAGFTTGAGSSSCAAPVGLTNSNIAATSVQCNWVAVTGVALYTIEYKLNTATTWTQAGTAAQNTYLLSGLTSGKTYDWRVKGNCSSFSNAGNFTTTSTISGGGTGGSTCSKPVNLSSTIISSSSARLSWGAVSGASNYTLQIRRQGAVSWYTLGTVSVISVRVIGLTPNQPYEWRLKANCSVWSDPAPLMAPGMMPESIPPVDASAPTLMVYPNPTNGLLTIEPGLRVEEALWVEVSDAAGRRVLERQPVANGTMSVDLSALQAGIYFLHLRNEERRIETKRVVKY